MKTLIPLLLSLAIVSLSYGQQESIDLSSFAPPLQDDYLIPILSLTANGDTLMHAEAFHQALTENGAPPRAFKNDQYIQGRPKGITYFVNEGVPVYAVEEGRVSSIRPDAFRGGFWLQVRHSKGLKSEYITLDQLQVVKGQKVSKGDVIGYTTETQFHFQLRIKKEVLDAPTHFYQKDKIVVKGF